MLQGSITDPYGWLGHIEMVSEGHGGHVEPLHPKTGGFAQCVTTTCVLVMSTVLKACSEGLYLVIRNGFRYILLSSREGLERAFSGSNPRKIGHRTSK